MPETNRPLKVFLCHSSNDKPAVRELYQKLRAEPWIEPWLDEEELYPGDDWDLAIEKAVENSDVVLVCLSNGSINKRGYVQKELRFALDIALEMPEETIFIVPLRLEECVPPRSLRDWQYADYFEDQREHAFKRLLVSFKKRANSLGLVVADKEKILDIDGNPVDGLIEKAILLIRDNQRASVPMLQNHLRISYLDAINLLDKIEAMGVVGPSKERDVFVGDDDLEKDDVDEEYIAADLRVESLETKLEFVEKKPAVEILRSEKVSMPSGKLTLSNGMEFMPVPAGKFIMGSESEGEKPQHTVEIPYDYWMARFPVTNEIYNAYVVSNEITHPASIKRLILVPKGGDETEIVNWDNKKDHPLCNIDWNNAIKYCQWLNDLYKEEFPSGFNLRLPTEAEWEKAARGPDSRLYPWGDKFDSFRCNTREAGLKSTSAVGIYSPQGDSPYGIADMMGNVWEWTHTLFKNYPYNSSDGRENIKTPGNRVLRGGSYNSEGRSLKVTLRWKLPPKNNGLLGGFRVCLAPPLPK